MTTRFGYGFERNSTDSPSAQDARAYFLKLLPQLNKEITTTLFDGAYIPFYEFLASNLDEILSIKRDIEPASFSMESAVRIFVNEWSALTHKSGGDLVSLALRTWATNWNFTDEWCLNHAVLTLREQHLSCIGTGLPHPRFTEEFWNRALFFSVQSEGIFLQADLIPKFRDKGCYEFTFSYEHLNFTVEGPVLKSMADFKKEVKKEFDAQGGRSVRSAGKVLQHQLTNYLCAVRSVTEELSLREPPVRWTTEAHFNWLLDYQLPRFKTYRQIARAVEKDEKTVREGVQRTASLIGLTLRSNEADKRSGRPKGAKDRAPRRRVDRRREKCGEMATNIS